MAKHVLRTNDGKKVVIDVEKDVKLYSAPTNPPNMETRYITGTDLLAHTTRNGNVFFYFYRWSMWVGDEETFELLEDLAEAEEYLTRKARRTGWAGLTDDEIARAKDFGIDILEETA